MDHNIKTVLDDDGVMVASIDMPGRSMNVFSLDMMGSLERLIANVEENGRIRAVVLTSGKPTFLAGADLDMIRMFTERARIDTHEQLHKLCGWLGRIFRRLEKSAKPYVAAINGLALGGGLEVSLACHARVIADDRKAQVGLPEIKLGLLPGGGGTQRLPRLIGTRLGLRMLLDGNPVSPAQALEAGIVDEVASPADLISAAKRRALALNAARAPWDVPGARFDCAPFDFDQADVHQQIAKALRLTDYQLDNYPAYKAIMNCVVGGWNKPMDEAGLWEMECFIRLIQDPVAGNMVRTLFLNRQRAAKVAPSLLTGNDIRISVVGGDNARVTALLTAAKVPVIDSSEVAECDTVLVVSAPQTEHGIRLRWLEGSSPITYSGNVDGAVWLSEATLHGQILEVCAPASNTLATDAGIMLARSLRATALVTRGEQALLPKLLAAQTAARRLHCTEPDELLAISLAAARAWSEGGIQDTELADVAAVVAGLHPAHTGGSYNYLLGREAAGLSAEIAAAAKKHPDLFFVPERLDELLKGPRLSARENAARQVHSGEKALL